MVGWEGEGGLQGGGRIDFYTQIVWSICGHLE